MCNDPPLAEAGRIQGNVILEITIDESGRASARRLVAGHPLLIAAAVASISDWRYRPFDAQGRPISVVTVVMVTFGDAANHRAEDNAEVSVSARILDGGGGRDFRADKKGFQQLGGRTQEGLDAPPAATATFSAHLGAAAVDDDNGQASVCAEQI